MKTLAPKLAAAARVKRMLARKVSAANKLALALRDLTPGTPAYHAAFARFAAINERIESIAAALAA